MIYADFSSNSNEPGLVAIKNKLFKLTNKCLGNIFKEVILKFVWELLMEKSFQYFKFQKIFAIYYARPRI
jgi:hypothetical protein